MKIDPELVAKMEKKVLDNSNQINKTKDEFVSSKKEEIIRRLKNTQESISQILDIVNLAKNYDIEQINNVLDKHSHGTFIISPDISRKKNFEIVGFNVSFTLNGALGNIVISENYINFCFEKNPYETTNVFYSDENLKIVNDDFDYLYRKTSDKNFTNEKTKISKLENAISAYETFERDINAAMIEYTVGIEEEPELD